MSGSDYLPPATRDKPEGDFPESLSSMLFDFELQHERDELEAFRQKYEVTHGPTDLTRYYTSERPYEEQAWLLENHPKHYFLGLPPFVRAFVREKVETAQQKGTIDMLHEIFLRLHVRGAIVPEGRSR